ncbi:hybrid sensor histidine kinase/response regulator [Chlorogloea sp. CCALA 695]|uniref:hybrid sensor histidine kinase/response regulator n=1 Tax=Chlorogloea sp. CCALA 695 TaxID=2107693 RepID=UPI000D067644|nr:response regulator [Chlorogloea sp. CCALA 695]PSB34833.1 hybrid sensor histidine kinase/response regulator [Chlorogloea sp. CCALA 695]
MDNHLVKVLLVDDDEDYFVLIGDWLNEVSAAKFQLEWVSTYSAAITAISQQQHDVYLFDYRLGSRNGLELLRESISIGCTAPIIMLTGIGEPKIDLEAMQAGAVDYLEKSLINSAILEKSLRYAIERKRSEQKIREQAALLDIATDAILVQDLQGKILFWNKGAEKLYGYCAAEAIGSFVSKLGDAEFAKEQELAKAVLLSSGAWQGELEQVSKDNNKVVVESRWTLVRDRTGQPTSILVVNTDITQKKQLEAQFLRAQRLESVGTLASGIAHDLNNVLTPILMSVQLLKIKFPEPQHQPLLKMLESNVKRGAALIKQVLSFARGIEGKKVTLQVRHLILEIEQIVRETFPKSIKFSSDIDSNLWTVSGDATQLHQVLMNLVVNALDAMPNGGTLKTTAKNINIDEHYARLHIDARVGAYITIAIADTGMGIAPETLTRIFEPFFTTKSLGAGTGLGLSTVLGIVKSHGGFIQVYSKVEQGTEFQIYLPAIQSTATQENSDFELPLGQGELILVVDDESAIREVTKVSLEIYNYKAITAADGKEAVALYTKHQAEIRVVLTDMMMPVMDGPTTIRTLQQINPNVKVIAVSGLSSSDKLAAAASSGVTNFLSKPFSAKELLQTLSSVLNAN